MGALRMRWAFRITQDSGIINTHHLFLNAMAWIFHVLDPVFGHLICRLVNEFLVNDDFLDALLAKEDFS